MPYLFLIAFVFASSAAMAETVALQFVILPKSSEDERIELRTGENESISLDVSPHKISKSYRVQHRKEWSVGKLTRAADGTKKFVEYGKVKSLKDQHQLIMLIRKGDTIEDGFKLVVLSDHLGRFGGGSFLMVNGSDRQVSGKLSEQEVKIAPGASSLVSPQPLQGKRIFHVTFSYLKEEKMKLFHSTKWPLHENARALICFYNDPKSSRMKIHAIREF
jgi:hypothetical protein